MMSIPRKSNAQSGKNGQQACLAGNGQVRQGYFAEVTLHHEQKADRTHFHRLMSAEYEAKLMFSTQTIYCTTPRSF